MFPSSFRANRLAACSVLLNMYEAVWYMGTALAFVAGSAVSCPAWIARVSSFFGVVYFSPFMGHYCITALYWFLQKIFQKEYYLRNQLLNNVPNFRRNRKTQTSTGSKTIRTSQNGRRKPIPNRQTGSRNHRLILHQSKNNL